MHIIEPLTAASGRAHQDETSLRVLFLVMGYPSAVWPTLGIFQRTMAECLQDIGIRVAVDAPLPYVPWGMERFSPKWKKYAAIPGRYMLNGIIVHSPRYFHIPYGDILSAPHVFIERATRSGIISVPDIIHAHFAYPAGLAAIRLSKCWGIPTLLTLHGSDVHRNPHLNPVAMRRFQRSVRDAAYVTTVSESLADHTEALCGRRPEVIPIGVRLDRFARTGKTREMRRQLGLPEDKHLALFVGALVKEKGVREFAGAIADGAGGDIMGVVVGDGPLQDELAGRRSLICLGSQPNEAIARIMQACDLIVLPSYGEGMPTVLVEAGAAELPILASRVGGIPELLGQGERGMLLETVTVQSVRDGIRRIVDDQTAAGCRSVAMKSFIESHYDARKNAALYAERYRACIDSAALQRDPGSD